jgi:hypothetical protein
MYQIPPTIFQQVERVTPLSLPASFIKRQFTYVKFSDANASMVMDLGGWISKIPAPRNPALDIFFDCNSLDYNGISRLYLIECSIVGTWLSANLVAGLLSLTVSVLGTFVTGIAITTTLSLLPITITLKPDDSYISFSSSVKSNWIIWSDVGNLDFTIGKDNVAGERPLDWKGNIYSIRKLGNKVIVYGQNGVSMLIPSGAAFGLNTFYRIGLKGKNAVTGDMTKNFFIDTNGCLWRLSETFESLGYEEYLSELNDNTVMSYDDMNNLVYICDGELGFVYNPKSKSLGEGPVNITGIGHQSGVTYITASSTIVNAPFSICTDIYDFGNRAGKTVFSLEFGTSLLTGLYAAVDWRRSKQESFTQTPWYTVSNQGRATILAYGREFRIRVKTTSYEYFELDYIKVNGVADAY